MAETAWAEEEVVAPPKKGVPTWVWGCGGGCLLLTILLVVGGVFVVDKVREVMDPEVVWPQIEEVLAFDERPTGYVVGGLASGGEGGFGMFNQSGGFMATLMVGTEGDKAEMDAFFEGETTGGIGGIGGIKDPELLDVTVKGRECRAIAYSNADVEMPLGIGQGQANADGQVLMIDITPDGGAGFRAVQLVRIDGKDATQETVDAFFEPFEPWR